MTFKTGDTSSLDRELTVFNQLVKEINDNYYASDFNGVDWTAIQAEYKALIQKGLALADFYQAMSQMVGELNDEGASSYHGPAVSPPPTASNTIYVGIGGSFATVSDAGKDVYVLNWVYPGSPAEQAGLKSHDLLLKVDGGPFMDDKGMPRALGAAGSTVVVTVQTPGQAPRDVKIVRAKISATQLVDSCLVAGTSIGYLRLVDISNIATLYQMLAALKKMSAGSPLQGIILDLRQVGGGNFNLSNLSASLGLFTSGSLGSFVNPRTSGTLQLFSATANTDDTSGAQKLPLVVLQDQNTFPAALSSGLLQLNGRARIVGQTAIGAFYWLWCDDTSDGSQLCVPSGVFQPEGKSPDYWKKTGVVPDVPVDGRWDQYTEATDPYLAKALELLTKK